MIFHFHNLYSYIKGEKNVVSVNVRINNRSFLILKKLRYISKSFLSRVTKSGILPYILSSTSYLLFNVEVVGQIGLLQKTCKKTELCGTLNRCPQKKERKQGN